MVGASFGREVLLFQQQYLEYQEICRSPNITGHLIAHFDIQGTASLGGFGSYGAVEVECHREVSCLLAFI